MPFELRADLPDWVLERLRKRMSDAEVLELARGLQRPAPLDLRVNSLKSPRGAVLDRLEFDNFAAVPGRLSPLAVRLKDKPALNQHPMFLMARSRCRTRAASPQACWSSRAAARWW